ncbi:MAG: signal recognition particle protein, partial [Verrucomicrobiota bacterium]
DTFKRLRGQGRISEKNVSDAMREIRMALLEADVEFSVAKQLIERVQESALGESVLKSVTPGQQIVKIFNDALVELLGGDSAPLDLNPPGRILIVGLNGAGKTTSSGKLALHLKKQGKKPALIACDLYRPAAVEQLATLGRELDVPVYEPEKGETNIIKASKKALRWIEKQGCNIAIFDTAGRQEVDDGLIDELKKLSAIVKARETLLVADSATGQQAVNVAKVFNDAVGLTGIVLTKLDGDARGGAALSIREVTNVPIKFIGEGEKMDQLFPFVPDRMASRILGMGDVISVVERAAEAIDEAEAERLAKRMEKNKFDFEDFLAQMKMMRSMGPMENILGMLPGMNKMKDLNVDEKRMARIEAIVLSMTPKERKRPELLNPKRRKRIAAGSGNTMLQVNQFLKQFAQMRKLMKSKGKMAKMMQAMGGDSGMGDLGGLGGLGKM